MPELPEVETIRIGLKQKIVGLKIKEVKVLNPKTFQGESEVILGLEVKEIWRRAKILGVGLENNQSLLIHLKMTGQLIYDDGERRLSGGHPTQDMRDQMPNKSTRVIFIFSNDSKLYFNDQRKFGWIKLAHSSHLTAHSLLSNLGPEPLEREFTLEIFKSQLQKRKKTPVKVAILDQTIVSGVGNIYACEACFLAQIDPRKRVNELRDIEIQKLHQGIIRSLTDGVKYGGSSRQHYVNSDGGKGNFLDYAFVYNRKGDSCRKCKTIIEKVSLGGRGTFYCPRCQA